MYSTIYAEWTADHFGLGLTSIDSLLLTVCAKNNSYIFVSSDLDL